MRKPVFFVVIIAFLLLPSLVGAAANVALNKPLTYDGSFGGGTDGRAVDGVFMARGTQWQTGSLWWSGLSPKFIIDLQGTFVIDSLIVQADSNDIYRVEYWNGSSWQTAWEVPNFDAYGTGLQTRPNPNDNTEKYYLPTPIVTNKLRVYAILGDNLYSVSEIQAFGTPASSPGAAFILLDQ